MKRITYAVALAAVAGSLFGGTANADPIRVCEDRDPVYDGCTYIYWTPDGPCVTGGGTIAGRHYAIAPC